MFRTSTPLCELADYILNSTQNQAHDLPMREMRVMKFCLTLALLPLFDRSIISRRQLAGVARANWDGDYDGEEPADALEHN
jgi:hypothetical protein